MQQGQQSNSLHTHVAQRSSESEQVKIDFEGIIDQLSNISQQLCRQLENSTTCLCRYLVTASQGKIHLHLHKATDSLLLSASTTALRIPVVYLDRMYGTLYLSHESGQVPLDTVTPVNAIYRLAEKCGWILYTCEITALIQSQCQHLNFDAQSDLTQQEKVVLFYLCCGKTKDEIANILSITLRTVEKHKQHIYEKFNVHNAYEVVYVAYKRNLFSPFDKSDK